MKGNQLVILAIVGVVGYLLYKRMSAAPSQPASTTSAPAPAPNVAPPSGSNPSTFDRVLGLIGQGLQATTAIAQAVPKQN